jgi:hypothetical protein
LYNNGPHCSLYPHITKTLHNNSPHYSLYPHITKRLRHKIPHCSLHPHSYKGCMIRIYIFYYIRALDLKLARYEFTFFIISTHLILRFQDKTSHFSLYPRTFFWLCVIRIMWTFVSSLLLLLVRFKNYVNFPIFILLLLVRFKKYVNLLYPQRSLSLWLIRIVYFYISNALYFCDWSESCPTFIISATLFTFVTDQNFVPPLLCRQRSLLLWLIRILSHLYYTSNAFTFVTGKNFVPLLLYQQRSLFLWLIRILGIYYISNVLFLWLIRILCIYYISNIF